jgi:hypothetical protein
MTTPERRKEPQRSTSEMRKDLTEAQRTTLNDLERFGWQLKVVRRPLVQPSIPVVFAGDRKTFAVHEADGTLNEQPGFDIRAG